MKVTNYYFMSLTLSIRDFLRGFSEYRNLLSLGKYDKIIVLDKNKNEEFIFTKEISAQEKKRDILKKLEKDPILSKEFVLDSAFPQSAEKFFQL